MQHKINDVSCYVSMGCVTYDRGLGSLAAVLVAIILVVSDMLKQNVVVVVVIARYESSCASCCLRSALYFISCDAPF